MNFYYEIHSKVSTAIKNYNILIVFGIAFFVHSHKCSKVRYRNDKIFHGKPALLKSAGKVDLSGIRIRIFWLPEYCSQLTR